MADEAWKAFGCGIIRFILFSWKIVSVAIGGNGGTACVAISIIIIVVFRIIIVMIIRLFIHVICCVRITMFLFSRASALPTLLV